MRPVARHTQETGGPGFAGARQTASLYATQTSTQADTSAEVVADALPVLPSTLLGLELLSQRPAFDLRTATRLVRDDPGAVLQIFRALAQESPDETDRPLRLEACLSSLRREHLLQVLAGRGEGCGRSRTTAFTEHAVAVARCAEMVAGTLGLAAEPARLVGLLHELGDVPAVLGWSGWPVDVAARCDRLARAHGLPTTLRRALDEVHREVRDSVWTAVVAAAHELLRPRA